MSDEFEKDELEKDNQEQTTGSVYRYSRDQIKGQYTDQDDKQQNLNYQSTYNQNGYSQSNYSQNSYNYGQNYGQNQNEYAHQQYHSDYRQNQQYRKVKDSKVKKNSFPGWVKAICYALIFGLVAGTTFEGVHFVGNRLFNSNLEINKVIGENSSTRTIDVVKVSDKDVPTIEAQDVSDIVDEVMPSIVAVNTVIEKTSKDFFGRTYSQQGAGAGSGFIFSEDGDYVYVATNYHVVENSKSIEVTFCDSKAVTATIKGYDENADVAVLLVKVNDLEKETKDKIKVAVLGDSDAIKAGNGAIAIGNALGYGQSVTTGAISAVERTVQLTDGSMNLIQTSAAINPGNSGGALLNARGEVIGINTIKYATTTVEGMGFAIPINSAMDTINAILSGEIVNKSDNDSVYLGIKGGTVDEDSAERYGFPQGVYVSTVYINSAAYRAGIQAGYIITGFNGKDILTMEELQKALAECNPGDTATIRVSIPDDAGEYTSEEELTTILGSKAEAPQE